MPIPFAFRRTPLQKAFAVGCMMGGALVVAVPCSALKLRSGQLRAVRPVVETRKKKKTWNEVHDRTSIVYGDSIRVGAKGSAQVWFNDDSVLYLRSGAHVRIEEPESNTQTPVVSVFGALGELFLSAKGPIKIRTAAATAAVRSASFSLRQNGVDESIVTVKTGSVQFYNDFNPVGVTVEEGYQSRAKVGSAPTPPERVDVSGLLSWTGEVGGLPLPFELPPTGGTAGNAAPQDAIDAAKRELQLGNAVGAQKMFNALLDSPRGDEALAGKALALLSNGQRVEARATVANATTPLALGVRALFVLEDGDARGAQQLLEPLVTAPGAPYQLLSLLALAQIQNGDLAGAQQTAERAVANGRQSAGARATLALAKFFRGNDKGARVDARHAIELDPFSPLALLAAGRIEASYGNLDVARRALERVIVLDPNLPGVQRDLGTLELARDLGAIETRLDFLPRAENAYRVALAQQPNDARSLAGLGTVLRLRGNATGASEYLERAVESAPDDAFVRAQQIDFLVKQGDLEVALQRGAEFLARRAGTDSTDANPARGETLGSDDPTLGALLVSLSEAALFRQKLNLALDYANRAVRLLPNSSLAQYQLGRVFLEQGRTTQAQSRFLLATILDQNAPRARYALGLTQDLIARGDDIGRVQGQIQAAREGAPNAALSLQDQSTPGASQLIQASIQDPTSVRAASRSFGNWQLSGRLGSDSQATGEISYLNTSKDERGLAAFGLRRDTTQGARPGSDFSQSQAAITLGRKDKDSPSSVIASISYDNLAPVTDGDFDQPTQVFPFDVGRRRAFVGANIAHGQDNQTRVLVQVDRNAANALYSNGPFNNRYDGIHGEVRNDLRLSEKWNLSTGGSWGQRRYDIATQTDLSTPEIPLVFFNSVNYVAHNAVAYTRAAYNPSSRLKLEAELKLRSISTHLISQYSQEPADPTNPPFYADTNTQRTQVSPLAVATYRSGRSTLWRFRARRSSGAIDDFDLLSPVDFFGFNSSYDVPSLSFGARGRSYELEVNHTFANSSFLRLGLFRISQGVGARSDTGEQFDYSRVQGARIGYEGLLNRNTSFFTSATLNSSSAQTRNPLGEVYSQTTLSGLPKYSAEVGVQYLSDSGFFVQPSIGYIGSRYRTRVIGEETRQEVGGFALLNLRIGVRSGLKSSFYIEGSNLLNRSYTLAASGFQRLQPGFQIRIGGAIRF